MSLNLDVVPESRSGSQVRVLVVDDSAFMRTTLSRMIASESNFEVVGTARDGTEALAKIVTLNPDVVTLDVEMPGINGIETLRCIMSQFPRPVIMVSAVTERGAQATFDALEAGAFDYVPKQMSATSLDITHIRPDLIAKLRAAAQWRKIAAPSSIRPASTQPAPAQVAPKKPPQPSLFLPKAIDSASADRVLSEHAMSEHAMSEHAIVALGASTGGPKALQEILPLIPRDLSVPILIVQHMPVGFTTLFAQRLNSLCSVEVREASHGETTLPGVIYIAPAGFQMTIQRQADSRATIYLDPNPTEHMHKPSVDIMMKSVAQNFGNLAMGVILSGMGTDGAEGMKAIRLKGGLTIGQDEASCTVYSMPRACAELGVLARSVPLFQIPNQILEATRCRRRA